MDVLEAIRTRRSIKRFADRPLTREEIEPLLEAAVLAPNHRMTEPWEFLVLGERARRAYAEALGRRKARRVEEETAKAAVRAKVMGEVMGVPAIIAVTCRLAEEPEIREEDYAATFMAIQNLSLAATAHGLGSHIKTGGVMGEPDVREALGVPEDRRIVAVLYVGVPAEPPPPKPRTPAREKTRWLD
ncbi:MAG TPA: nitroreductase [Longimicrobiales bacterium]